MKLRLLTLATGAVMSASVFASPLPSLPTGGLVIKFAGLEQIATVGTTGYGNEINWGVVIVTSITPGQETSPGSNIVTPSGFDIFSNNGVGGQITGMFYGVEKYNCVTTGCDPFPATSGFLDLYYRDIATYGSTFLTGATPGVRIDADSATGYTQGTLLAHLSFAPGINGEDGLFISGNVTPTTGFVNGIAESYADADPTQGLWGAALNTDAFEVTTDAGAQTRDVRFKNSYNYNQLWDGCALSTQSVCIGASLDDPATGFVVPEPGSIALLGLGLVGLAASRRRKV